MEGPSGMSGTKPKLPLKSALAATPLAAAATLLMSDHNMLHCHQTAALTGKDGAVDAVQRGLHDGRGHRLVHGAVVGARLKHVVVNELDLRRQRAATKRVQHSIAQQGRMTCEPRSSTCSLHHQACPIVHIRHHPAPPLNSWGHTLAAAQQSGVIRQQEQYMFAAPSCPRPPGCPPHCRCTPTPRGRPAPAPCRCRWRLSRQGRMMSACPVWKQLQTRLPRPAKSRGQGRARRQGMAP